MPERFVALGDSTTEGLEDPHPRGGHRNWADRLAERIARAQPGLLYANLAVRGRKMAQIREEQLEPALSMRPDLASVVGGLNDILRARCDVGAVAGHLEATVAALRAQGATVLGMTFLDPASVMPLARPARARILAYNEAVRQIAARHGMVLVDFERHGVADARLWHPDRLHANAEGHARIAAAAAEALGIPGDHADWRAPLAPLAPVPRHRLVVREAAWAGRHLAPWVARRLRGRSSGDGRAAKRPRLEPVVLPDDHSG